MPSESLIHLINCLGHDADCLDEVEKKLTQGDFAGGFYEGVITKTWKRRCEVRLRSLLNRVSDIFSLGFEIIAHSGCLAIIPSRDEYRGSIGTTDTVCNI
ncbi:hypothetical protein L1887_06984 [Cichorium endivia]|nr:hypothetical protein L1887_06984 [Cichorium endivia]